MPEFLSMPLAFPSSPAAMAPSLPFADPADPSVSTGAKAMPDRDAPSTFITGPRSFVLSPSLRMGLIARIIDFFRGGTRRAEIDRRVDAICTPDHALSANGHAERLDHFVALRDQARQKYQDRFDVSVTLDPAATSWSYTFRIDGTVLLSSTVPLEDGRALAAFRSECARAGIGLGKDGALRVECAAACLRHGIGADTDDARLLMSVATRLAAHRDTASPADDGASRVARDASALLTLPAAFARIDARAAASGASAPRHANMAEKLVLLGAAVGGGLDRAVKLTFGEGRQSYGVTVGTDASPVHVGTLEEGEYGQFPQLVSAGITLETEALKRQFDAHIRDPVGYMRGNIDTMTDDPGQNAWLVASADAPGYGSADFTGIREEDPGATFVAMFGEREVRFSDRGNEHSELRGPLLRDALSTTTFATLGEIMRRGHMTASDPTLRYLMPVLRAPYAPLLERLSAAERAAVKRAVAPIPFGLTTLGALWEIDPGARADAVAAAAGDPPEDGARPLATPVLDFPRDGQFA